MNKQKTSETSRGIEWTDYTWNPIKGCLHGCSWNMPDGSIANCYAEDVANRVARTTYPEGFEHHYFEPKRLDEPAKLKTPSRIFVGSMADVFGHWVPGYHIDQVLEVCESCPQHTFQFLTKNPLRALNFPLPKNVWLGCSMPPDSMWGKPLSHTQKRRMFEKSLGVLGQLKVRGVTTWISAEPLSWDINPVLQSEAGWIADPYQCPVFDWIVIGAASNGRKHIQPNESYLWKLRFYCIKHHIPIYMKGNLKKSLGVVFDVWHEEFPARLEAGQGELFS